MKPISLAYDSGLDELEKEAIKNSWVDLLGIYPDRGFIFSGDGPWNERNHRKVDWYIQNAPVFLGDNGKKYIDVDELWMSIATDQWLIPMPLSLIFVSCKMMNSKKELTYHKTLESIAIQSVWEFRQFPREERIAMIKGSLWYNIGRLAGSASDIRRKNTICHNGQVYCTSHGCIMNMTEGLEDLATLAKKASLTGIFCKKCRDEARGF